MQSPIAPWPYAINSLKSIWLVGYPDKSQYERYIPWYLPVMRILLFTVLRAVMPYREQGLTGSAVTILYLARTASILIVASIFPISIFRIYTFPFNQPLSQFRFSTIVTVTMNLPLCNRLQLSPY